MWFFNLGSPFGYFFLFLIQPLPSWGGVLTFSSLELLLWPSTFRSPGVSGTIGFFGLVLPLLGELNFFDPFLVSVRLLGSISSINFYFLILRLRHTWLIYPLWLKSFHLLSFFGFSFLVLSLFTLWLLSVVNYDEKTKLMRFLSP